MISSKFPAGYDALLAEARALAAQVMPLAAQVDESTTLDDRVLAALRESGLSRVMIPALWGGRTDAVDPVGVCLVREVLMPASAQLDAVFALQGIGSYAVVRAGSAEQQERWLPLVAECRALAALALTEPQAGSDLKAIETTLTEEGGVLRLTGMKSFISNAGEASFYTVLAREANGYSLVLVPADAPGITVSRHGALIAPHVIGDVQFGGVALDRGARIGAPGDGFDLVLATLTMFRASVAGAAVGLAGAALDAAVAHAKERIQFGRPLIKQGQVGAMLADSWVEIEMARLLTYHAAAAVAAGDPDALMLSSGAKLAASETAARVTDRAVQVMGRFGLVRGTNVERYYRQARALRIYEGASEVLRAGIAKRLGED